MFFSLRIRILTAGVLNRYMKPTKNIKQTLISAAHLFKATSDSDVDVTFQNEYYVTILLIVPKGTYFFSNHNFYVFNLSLSQNFQLSFVEKCQAINQSTDRFSVCFFFRGGEGG